MIKPGRLLPPDRSDYALQMFYSEDPADLDLRDFNRVEYRLKDGRPCVLEIWQLYGIVWGTWFLPTQGLEDLDATGLFKYLRRQEAFCARSGTRVPEQIQTGIDAADRVFCSFTMALQTALPGIDKVALPPHLDAERLWYFDN